MLTLASLGALATQRRHALGLRQLDVVQRSGVSRATLDSFENGRAGELGFTKIAKILSVLGLELKLAESSSGRPTLEDLLRERSDD